jgi:hypothetical protein
MTVENDASPMNIEEPLDFKLELADKVRTLFFQPFKSFYLMQLCDQTLLLSHVSRQRII